MKEVRLQTEYELVEEVRGLKDILNVAQVVVSSLELDEVLQNILHSAMAIMDIPAGSIALYDEASSCMELHVHAGLSEGFVANRRWQVKPGGLTLEILERGELFVIEDTARAAFLHNPLVIEEGIRSLIAAPLKFQNKIIGILYVDDFQPRQFPPVRLNLFAILASFATMSIDNARLHAQTAQLACTDGLTGLYNYRQFKKQLDEEVARAIRYRKPLSIILFDVDDFKMFNDAHGHPAGDLVLQGIADLLRELLRGCDALFRYAGEEFVALLPETPVDEALLAAERIRCCIEARSPGFAGHLPRAEGVTVSVGVAALPENGAHPDLLLKAVDDLMYMAKREGKNKVFHWSGGQRPG